MEVSSLIEMSEDLKKDGIEPEYSIHDGDAAVKAAMQV